MTMQRYDSGVEIPHFGAEDNDRWRLIPPTSPDRSPADPPEQACSSPPNQPQTPSRLLSLPAELQLRIWEFAVIESEPLYVNCPCDSSFGGRTQAWYDQIELWERGEKHPPWQPSLTRVCRSIRADALPMFYKHNAFQAGYCYETELEDVVDWLKTIGEENRKMMRDFYLFDENPRHDGNCPKDLKKVLRGQIVRKMGGSVKSVYTEEYCRHEVKFGLDENSELDGLEAMFEMA